MTERELSTEILTLTVLCQQGDASEEERARLEYLLSESAEARLAYTAVACDSVTLSEVSSKNSMAQQTRDSAQLSHADSESQSAVLKSRSRTGVWQLLFALAVSILLASWGLRHLDLGAENASLPENLAIARVVRVDEVVWEPGTKQHTEWSKLDAGESLQIASGMVEVVVNDAVQLVIQGPANFELVSRRKAIAHSGKLVARVGEAGIGFEIETPHAHVIDQGTAFSISVTPDSKTDVVVYEGIVDLAARANKQSTRRLESGEGIQVDTMGRLNRITSVKSTDFLPPLRLGRESFQPSRLIRAVTDNVVSLETAKYCRIVGEGFEEDCTAYVDRVHQWNGIDRRGIPAFLRGADYVMTYNDDKVIADLQIAIELAQPVSLYVIWDDRVVVPRWLAKDFADTGWNIGLDEGYPDRYPTKSRLTATGAGASVDFVFSIWKQDFQQPSTAVLGSVQPRPIDIDPREVSQSMYGIAVAPLTRRD